MRDRLETSVKDTFPRWLVKDECRSELRIHELYLEGEIYKHLDKEFDEESTPSGGYIRINRRKPCIQFNLARTLSQNIARKLFAGRHAPSLIHEEKPEVVNKIKKLLEEAKLECAMIEAITKVAVGASCLTFKIVKSDEGVLTITTTVYSASDCYPRFDAARQLSMLRIPIVESGQWFTEKGYFNDSEGDEVDKSKTYWCIKEIDNKEERYFLPIKSSCWNPLEGPASLEIKIQEGVLAPVKHNLGLMPAVWFRNLHGEFPIGSCLFKPALPNIVEYDYGMSQLSLGMKNAACPMTVIEGALIDFTDENGKPVPKSPSRILQFAAKEKDETGAEVSAGKAYYLETNGQSFIAGLAYYRQVKKDAHEQIHASRKDPEKMTTAMSGKAMDAVEEEYGDLAFELRSNFGPDYLSLVKRITRAAITVGHPKANGISSEDVEDLTAGWPDLHDETPQEFQQRVAGIAQGVEAGIMHREDGVEHLQAKTDVAQTKKKGLPKLPKQPTKSKEK